MKGSCLGPALIAGGLLACNLPNFENLSVGPPEYSRPFCSVESDCPGPTYCVEDPCSTVKRCGCDDDSQCPREQVCASDDGCARTCRGKPCTLDDDCSADAYCDGACKPATLCASDADCTDGERCGFPQKQLCGAGDGGGACDHTKKVCTEWPVLECGEQLCPERSFWPACCLEGAGDRCGITTLVGCRRLGTEEPGVLDATCPPFQNGFLEVAPGCCRPDGYCGTMLPVLGCVLVEREWLDAAATARCGSVVDAVSGETDGSAL